MSKPCLHVVENASPSSSRTGAHEEIPASLRKIAAGCLSDAMGVHRVTSGQFSEYVGVGRQRVDRWINPDDDLWMSGPRLLMAARHHRGRAVALSYLAALRGHIDDEPAPVASSGTGLLEQAFDAMADVGRLADDTRKALSPTGPGGREVTEEERVQLLRDAEVAIARLLHLTKAIRGGQ